VPARWFACPASDRPFCPFHLLIFASCRKTWAMPWVHSPLVALSKRRQVG
jgi:hypothetical protein